MSRENVELIRRALDVLVCDVRDGKVWRAREFLHREQALEAAGLSE